MGQDRPFRHLHGDRREKQGAARRVAARSRRSVRPAERDAGLLSLPSSRDDRLRACGEGVLPGGGPGSAVGRRPDRHGNEGRRAASVLPRRRHHRRAQRPAHRHGRRFARGDGALRSRLGEGPAARRGRSPDGRGRTAPDRGRDRNAPAETDLTRKSERYEFAHVIPCGDDRCRHAARGGADDGLARRVASSARRYAVRGGGGHHRKRRTASCVFAERLGHYGFVPGRDGRCRLLHSDGPSVEKMVRGPSPAARFVRFPGGRRIVRRRVQRRRLPRKCGRAGAACHALLAGDVRLPFGSDRGEGRIAP